MFTTCCQGNQAKQAMQLDGNLVLYKAEGPVWDSATLGVGQGPYRITLSNSGVLEVTDATGHVTWRSR